MQMPPRMIAAADFISNSACISVWQLTSPTMQDRYSASRQWPTILRLNPHSYPIMKTNIIAARGLEILALAMVGEGVIGLLRPRRYSLFWKLGPGWLRHTTETLAEHREATRLLCAGEIALGLWLAMHEMDKA